MEMVREWEGWSGEGREVEEDGVKVFEVWGVVDGEVGGLRGERFLEVDVVESDRNEKDEDIVESIEV